MRRAAILRRWATGGLALVLVGGCGGSPPTPELFPLEPGREWRYAETIDKGGERSVSTLAIRTLAPRAFAGSEYAVRHTSDGTDYLIGADQQGIYRFAKRTVVQSEPQADAERRYVLKAPFVVGTTWGHTTPVLLIDRQRADSGDTVPLVHDYTVPMTYQIEAVDASIEVAAGRFQRCLVVRGTAGLTLFVDPDQGFVEIPITSLETFCPGVGLVRMERREEVSAHFYQGGTAILELLAFTS